MYPAARSTQLTVQELPDETLVFDHQTNKAHCLNRTTALIWKHCDGKTSRDELASRVEREFGVENGQAIVELALEQLASRHLLQSSIRRASPAKRRSRRELLKKMAVAAIPIILTVVAPRAAQAASQRIINIIGSFDNNVGGNNSGTNTGPPATQTGVNNSNTGNGTNTGKTTGR